MAQCAHIYSDAPKNRDRNRVGKQCGQKATSETPYCRFHGGANQATVDKARRERYEAEIKDAVEEASRPRPDANVGPAFTGLWREDHERLDPFSLMLWEIRRSGSRIEWFDAQLDAIAEEKDLWWGLAKKEVIGAAEFQGTNKTYEAKEHVLVKMQNEERKRLMELRNEWQNNRFEAAKIAGYGAFRSSMRNAINAVMDEFGHDLRDPAIQDRLRAALEALPEPILGIDAPEVKAIKPGQQR